MKRFSLLLGAATAAFAAFAQLPDYRSVVVERTDGTTLSVALSSTVALGFEGAALTVTDSKSGLSLQFPKAEFAGFRLSTEEAAVEAPRQTGVEAVLIADGLEIKGLRTGAQVVLYHASGHRLWRTKAQTDRLTVPRERMRPGVNVVSVEGETFKVVVP